MTEEPGFDEYFIRYLLKNLTPDQVIDEGSFKAYFEGAGAEPQYGFFGKLFPGESLTRSYTWKVLKSQRIYLIEYEGDFFGDTPGATTLKWLVP